MRLPGDGAVEIGRLLGVPLRLHPTGVAGLTATNCLAVLVVGRLARPDWDLPSIAGVALGVAVLLQVSAVLHELAHMIAALCVGERVRALGLSLLGGYIYVESTSNEETVAPGAMAIYLLAGPLASLALWIGCAMAAAALREVAPAVALALGIAGALNLVLLILNLLPVEPLDGGRLLRVLGRAWRRRAAPELA